MTTPDTRCCEKCHCDGRGCANGEGWEKRFEVCKEIGFCHDHYCPCHKHECNCATARGIEWTCPVHGRMWREKEVAGWSKRFDETYVLWGEILQHRAADGIRRATPEDLKSFIAKEIEAAEARGRNALINKLDDTRYADAFLGFTDEEWRGAKKFIDLFLGSEGAARQIPGV